ncbi:MAG: hypothetical protein NVSMB49_01000 [Ktedonobacteraceae bacterium]
MPRNEMGDDEEWITCDNKASSLYYGHCYVEWDDAVNGGLVLKHGHNGQSEGEGRLNHIRS